MCNIEEYCNSVENELIRINNYVNNLIRKYENDKNINPEYYLNVLDKTLFRVGDLSQPVFQIKDELEKNYYSKSNNYKLSKKLFLDHYNAIHKPFDKTKNKVWDLIDRVKRENLDSF